TRRPPPTPQRRGRPSRPPRPAGQPGRAVRSPDQCELWTPCLRDSRGQLRSRAREKLPFGSVGFPGEEKPLTHDAHAFWLRAPGQGEIRPAALPEPGPGDVHVRTLYSGVSRGTETLVFRGGVPASQYATMRAPFQEGDFPGPVKYGYLNVGVVES